MLINFLDVLISNFLDFIQAAVLVIFVVLVVPIFLDGPPADGEVVSERVLLPGQDEQKTQTVVLDRDRTEPVPSATPTPAETTPEPQAQQEQIATQMRAKKLPLAICQSRIVA